MVIANSSPVLTLRDSVTSTNDSYIIFDGSGSYPTKIRGYQGTYLYLYVGSYAEFRQSASQTYCYGTLTATAYTDHTPMCDLETAKRAVNSFQVSDIKDGYGNDQIDHGKLDPFVHASGMGWTRDEETGEITDHDVPEEYRDIGASVTANTLVIQYLMEENELLKQRLINIEKEIGL